MAVSIGWQFEEPANSLFRVGYTGRLLLLWFVPVGN
jgi:hypothetical protein